MTEVLPSGWAQVALSEVCLPVAKTDPRDRPHMGFDYIDIGGILPGSGHIRETKWLLGDDAPSRARQAVQTGDVILSTVRTYQRKTAIVPAALDGAVASTGFTVLRLVPEIDARFTLFQVLSHEFVSLLNAKQTGTSYPAVRDKDVRGMSIRVAPSSEQARIVTAIEEHFSRLDAVDISLSAAEMRCHALTRSILVGSIPNELPKDWQLKTVAEAGETGLGRQRSPKYHSGPNMKPYLRVANVFEDRIDTSSIMEMHFEEAEFDKYRLRYGDVLLNEGQSPELLGRPAIYVGEPPDIAFTNSLIRFVPGPGVMSEWALLVFRRHMHARRFMRESRITTNIAHLALGRFRTVEFPTPPLKTQRELVASTRASFSSVDQLIDQIRSARARTQAMRRAVLAAAFSGQLVPQDRNDEPALALLERIAASRAAKPKRQKVSS